MGQSVSVSSVDESINAGNIKSRTEYAYTNGTLGSPTGSITYTYNTSIWRDMLRSYGNSARFSYDNAGNITSDGVWTYWWKHGRQLAYMKQGNTIRWDYTYDANGLRTKRTDGTNTYTYVYNGSKLVQMSSYGYTYNFTYDANGTPLTVTVNNYTYYYVTNLQGDVIGILDEDGEQVITYQYTAWGAVTVIGDEPIGTFNPLRYRGYVYDNETALYYLQSRYYNPEWGRFINADALVNTGQGLLGNNMFAYCGNNPVNRSDEGGEAWHILAGALIGGVASFATTLLTGGSLAEAGVSALFGAASGALTAAVPGAGFLIDVGFGIAEEITINAIKGKSFSDSVVDTTVSAGVDSVMNLSCSGSDLTKETMEEFAEAIPKTFKGNHPAVKKPAQKIVRRVTKTMAKETGETVAQKTFGNVLKNILKSIF